MFTILLGLITGLAGPITNLIGKITDLNIAKVNAASDVDKAAIDAQIEEAHDRKAVLIAEAGNRLEGMINSVVRLVITLGPASYLFKVFLWDKVIGSMVGCVGKDVNCPAFTTDPLDANLWAVVVAVIAFYFVYDIMKRR